MRAQSQEEQEGARKCSPHQRRRGDLLNEAPHHLAPTGSPMSRLESHRARGWGA